MVTVMVINPSGCHADKCEPKKLVLDPPPHFIPMLDGGETNINQVIKEINEIIAEGKREQSHQTGEWGEEGIAARSWDFLPRVAGAADAGTGSSMSGGPPPPAPDS